MESDPGQRYARADFEEAHTMGMVRGTVLALNRRRRMAIVGTDEGACSVIGGFGEADGPEFNDVVSGPLDTPGSQFLYNETRCAWFSGFLRLCGCSFQDAVRETR
jgi:hypothetical protein